MNSGTAVQVCTQGRLSKQLSAEDYIRHENSW